MASNCGIKKAKEKYLDLSNGLLSDVQ